MAFPPPPPAFPPNAVVNEVFAAHPWIEEGFDWQDQCVDYLKQYIQELRQALATCTCGGRHRLYEIVQRNKAAEKLAEQLIRETKPT